MKKKQISISIEPHVHVQLKILAKNKGMNVSSFLILKAFEKCELDK